MKIKSLLLDGLFAYTFWMPFITITVGFLSKWTFEQWEYYALIGLPANVGGGMTIYKFRLIERWRQAFKYS